MLKKDYFLHTQACNVTDTDAFKHGMSVLNHINQQFTDDEAIYKNPSLYLTDGYVAMLTDYDPSGQVTQALIPFIEQCATYPDGEIATDSAFQAVKRFANSNAGFLGINFLGIDGIAAPRRITSPDTYTAAKHHFLDLKIKTGDRPTVAAAAQEMFRGCIFLDKAIDHLCQWQRDPDTIDHIKTLISDIPAHPFVGGMGDTENLKGRKDCTKNINGADRLLYELTPDAILIKSLKGHADTSAKYRH